MSRNGHVNLADVPVDLRVKTLRAELGLNQREMADRVGVNVRQVKRWESGLIPSERSAKKLARVRRGLHAGLFFVPEEGRREEIAELRLEVEKLKRRVARLER